MDFSSIKYQASDANDYLSHNNPEVCMLVRFFHVDCYTVNAVDAIKEGDG